MRVKLHAANGRAFLSATVVAALAMSCDTTTPQEPGQDQTQESAIDGKPRGSARIRRLAGCGRADAHSRRPTRLPSSIE
jgi:hypothetical protein